MSTTPRRKTIDVETLRKEINRRLATSTCTPEEREAMASVLEFALFETGNYKGYTQLSSEYAKEGDPIAEGTSCLRVGYDESRRAYF